MVVAGNDEVRGPGNGALQNAVVVRVGSNHLKPNAGDNDLGDLRQELQPMNDVAPIPLERLAKHAGKFSQDGRM